MKINVYNKVAVFTGGSGYLCSEIVRALADNEARVVILSRREKIYK